jgi:hypothetical protein
MLASFTGTLGALMPGTLVLNYLKPGSDGNSNKMRHKRMLLSQLAVERSFDVFSLCVESCVNGLLMQSETIGDGYLSRAQLIGRVDEAYELDERVGLLLNKRSLLAGHFQYSLRHQVNSFFQHKNGRLCKTQVEREANRLTVSAERLGELERRMSRTCDEELRQLQCQLSGDHGNVAGKRNIDPLSPRIFCRALRDSLTYGFERKEQTLDAFTVMRVPFCLAIRQEYGTYLQSLSECSYF